MEPWRRYPHPCPLPARGRETLTPPARSKPLGSNCGAIAESPPPFGEGLRVGVLRHGRSSHPSRVRVRA
ncbi:hypothetical protein FGU64_16575 [Mesorhizobium sp. 8]|nr:hypothetical protein FGU64_16575 [Mesorhizobium sp. 8]